MSMLHINQLHLILDTIAQFQLRPGSMCMEIGEKVGPWLENTQKSITFGKVSH